MELEQEIKQAELCKEIKLYLLRWECERKEFLVKLLCTCPADEVLSIRGELKGLTDFFNSLNTKIDNSKVAKQMLKEL
jgi:hypothetical protein